MSLFSLRVRGVSIAFAAVGIAASARAQCNGAWVPNALPSLASMSVTALAVIPGATGLGLVAGGQSSPTDMVRVLHGNTWAPLGGGVSASQGTGEGKVGAIAVLPDGSIVVGGYILNAGSLHEEALLRWDGASWSLVGGGMGIGANVTSLLVEPDGSLVAGGYLRPGNTNAYGVARWSPGADHWTGLAGAPAGLVYAVARRPNGNIIAAGDTSVAEWNGATWTTLGSMASSVGATHVLAVAVLPSGDLVAAGSFTTVGGVQVHNAARWDGVNWFAMAQNPDIGFPILIFSLILESNGDLIAGGLGSIVRWNGSVWSRVGPPNVADQIYAMVRVGSSGLVAGGDGLFPRIDGMWQWHIGRYAPSTADFDQNGDVGSDADIAAFFSCLGGDCCAICESVDFNGDGDVGTDGDIEAFFRVLGGGGC